MKVYYESITEEEFYDSIIEETSKTFLPKERDILHKQRITERNRLDALKKRKELTDLRNRTTYRNTPIAKNRNKQSIVKNTPVIRNYINDEFDIELFLEKEKQLLNERGLLNNINNELLVENENKLLIAYEDDDMKLLIEDENDEGNESNESNDIELLIEDEDNEGNLYFDAFEFDIDDLNENIEYEIENEIEDENEIYFKEFGDINPNDYNY
jgi:hypothetical protein